MTFTLNNLDYEYRALEPYFDAQTMEIHHTRHHQAYIDKANAALAGTAWEGKSFEEILKNLDKIPDDKKSATQNNVGGHANHTFFWNLLTPNGPQEPVGDLSEAIDETFGGYEKFREKFTEICMTRFGSGWGWLVKNPNGSLEITSTTNQDNPISQGQIPIIGLDVWEHAYYLKYQNKRPDYINAFWSVVNWNKAEENFQN